MSVTTEITQRIVFTSVAPIEFLQQSEDVTWIASFPFFHSLQTQKFNVKDQGCIGRNSTKGQGKTEKVQFPGFNYQLALDKLVFP